MGCNESKTAAPVATTGPSNGGAKEMPQTEPAAEPQLLQTEFEWDEAEDEVGEMPEMTGPPPSFAKNRKQRQSVSAECFGDTLATYQKKKAIPKTEQAKEFLRSALKRIVLFMGIDDDQTNDVIDACEEFSAQAGEVIIKEGDKVADWFYILEEGTAEASIEGKGVVKAYKESPESFGELALMYSAPRAATVTATSDCRMWRLDRTTFQMIVIASTRVKREKYEKFLRSVPLLEVLDGEEIAALADVLEPTIYEEGTTVLAEGAEGDTFFIVEEGTITATTASGESATFEKASYFGELALLTKEPRKATCVATTRCKLIQIDVTAFSRLLGKAEEVLKRNAEKYAVFLEKGAAAVFTTD